MERLFLIDALNVLFRSYYAIGPMTNLKGQSTSALFGFIRSLQKIIKEFQPTHLAAIFDGAGGRSTRQESFEGYKANRKAAPEDLYPQIDLAINYCKKAGIPVFQQPRVEADDLIASIAKWAEDQGATTFICTSDKDLCQLVNEKTFVLNVHKDNLLMDARKVEETFGVKPTQIGDFLALTGDASDNIPGVEGFGPKTAAKLLQEVGSLDVLLQDPDRIPPGKKRQTFLEQKERAILSKQLVSLYYSIPFPKEEAAFALHKEASEELKAFFQEMNFLSLLKEKEVLVPQETRELFLITNNEEMERAVATLSSERSICLSTLRIEREGQFSQVVGIGLGGLSKGVYYIPLNQLRDPNNHQILKRFFATKEIQFFGHDIKSDLLALSRKALTPISIDFDTEIASYLLHPHKRAHNLEQLSLEYLHHKKKELSEFLGSGKNQIPLDEAPQDLLKEICCETVALICQLRPLLEGALKKEHLLDLFSTIEIPLIPILAKMEEQGIFVDRELLASFSHELELDIRKIEAEIFLETGHTCNLNSPKQLAHLLFEELKLKPPGKKLSTAADVLEELAETTPIVAKILDYRSLEKLRSTYTETLISQIHKQTERIHCTFNQAITATGRLSCQHPNLQNIPIRTERGRKIREAFKPEKEGWLYLSADYSQIELRLLAHLSEDPELIASFLKGHDIHRDTAALIFDVVPSEVTKEMRSRAKAVNFGILYGQTAYGLSRELKISPIEAQKMIDTYFQRYKRVKEYIQDSISKAEQTGYALTISGRKRPIPDLQNKNPHIRGAAERLAINTPLQGSNADLIKEAMIDIQNWIEHSCCQGFMILQIHDELLFELPADEVALFTKEVKTRMEGKTALKVPLVVDVRIGKNWGEC